MRRLRRPFASALSGAALWAAACRRVAQWDQAARDPRAAQLDTLLSHCRAARDTELGGRHRLGDIRSYEQFREQVPCRTYADYEPWLVRMRAGERDVLWPGRVPYFALSSGTSGTAAGKKHLPLSWEQIAWQQRAGFDVVARYVALTGDRSLGAGYSLCLWPPGSVDRVGAVAVGSNPGLMSRHLPALVRRHALPDEPVRDIEDCQTKLDRLGDSYLEHDVRSMSGTTCWFSLVLDRVRRAAGVEFVSEVWPELKVLFGGGVPAAPYRAGLEARIGRFITFIDNYNATEGGIFASSDRADDDGLLVLPDRGVFFELIPREDLGRPERRRFPLWEAETGVEYAVVVTTASGLFAYELGDCVRFTQIRPHRLVFTGRVSGMLSLTQELTTQRELERAVGRALAAAGMNGAFAASTEMPREGGGRGRYVVFLELEREAGGGARSARRDRELPAERATPGQLAALERAVDQALGEENRVYGLHRADDVAILPLRIVPVQPGTLHRLTAASAPSGLQQKTPRILSPSQRDQLLALAGSG